MSQKTDKLKLELAKLTDLERAELQIFLNEYRASSYTQREDLTRKIRNSLGPTDSLRCAVCGK